MRETLNTALAQAGIEVRGRVTEQYTEVLTEAALAFLARLARKFEGRRRELLEQRAVRQREISAGRLPDFLPATRGIREAEWKVAPIPADLQDRRVEITGPVERKMIINALNSGANVFMADFEDSNTRLVRTIIAEELEKLKAHLDEAKFKSGKFDLAAALLEQITTNAEFPEFMTLVVYEHID